ncbi:GrpB family protein [Paenibacillus humicola]|uniref:GrpB family protein n=1 Tax=Paenibacillus humicola TaxID=3110540 RepID=UPI00237C01C0|nr:GrpB family protein [Paenibacillus humicola]
MARTWEVVPWVSNWARMYEKEADMLRAIFGGELEAIHHIGSTSVPAVGWAKPIIDILVVVRNINAVEGYHDKMRNAGYRPRGENGISGRSYFTKGETPRTHHVHVFQTGNESIRRHLHFKAFLMEHPEEAAAYGRLKQEILAAYPHTEYQQEKEKRMRPFVEKALNWGQER